MGRRRTLAEKGELAERARQLRAAGQTRRQIQAELGIGPDLAKTFLRGVPLPDSLARSRAKDSEREAAVVLRRAGKTYDQIAAELGVSKSSCSLWLRELPHPDTTTRRSEVQVDPDEPADDRKYEARRMRAEGMLLREIAVISGISAKTAYSWTWDLPVPARARSGGDRPHMDMMRRRYWDRVLAERESKRAAIKALHSGRFAALSPRELELAAVVAYWCEGCKSKPYARRERVTFINSDPGLVLVFLAWLDQLAFPLEHRRFSLSIHESADVLGATAWWSDVIGLGIDVFGPPSLKRHNPATVRKNVDDAYVGCLVVRLVQCRMLYQRIEGVWQGIMGGLDGRAADPREVPSRVV